MVGSVCVCVCRGGGGGVKVTMFLSVIKPVSGTVTYSHFDNSYEPHAECIITFQQYILVYSKPL